MKKETICLVLCVTLIMSVFACICAVNASAEKYGDFEYSVKDDGTIEINKYTGSDAKVEVPSEIDGKSVTEIGYEAFNGCTKLESIKIPNSVTSIGEMAFENTAYYNNKSNWENGALYVDNCLVNLNNADELTEFTVKDGTKLIASKIFLSCEKLETVNLPESLRSIGCYSFAQCSELKNISIPDGVTYIGESAFEECSGLSSIKLKGVTTIGDDAFYGCNSLESVSLSDNIIEIGEYAFLGTNLKSITIPNSIKKIGEYAFAATTYYNDQSNWKNNVLYIDNCLIAGNMLVEDEETGDTVSLFKVEGNYTVKDGTRLIANRAFNDCKNLKIIVIPDSVAYIGEAAFDGCENVCIYAYADSYAIEYAKKNNIKYEIIIKPTEPTTTTKPTTPTNPTTPTKPTNPTTTTKPATPATPTNPTTPTTTTAPTTPTDPSTIIYGDADGNGAVNPKDVMVMRKKFANWDVPNFNEKNADCNADSNFDLKDIMLLRKFIAQWDVKLGPQK